MAFQEQPSKPGHDSDPEATINRTKLSCPRGCILDGATCVRSFASAQFSRLDSYSMTKMYPVR
ncbi:hypothetical protein BO70DRAFT_364227 [Aspergillus heteromorphus CBS 117.55]|uniref:Uncharacterized protein n=1 Tax=Aspergillus heteromorphus CBS 117.55 TaxID=1448321 RepID=A0A317VQG4_9EURO|nr:uncharacterized protein BO70DRAFT_364227 [Aspergillus heteromorphus CBS 117.55]PWY75148.1 hypothetical protein BO70DRAFT_364227 [Aspergillus heteromorphus CBS 117.55]